MDDSLFARLFFDMMLPTELAEALRARGYDVAEARHLARQLQRDDWGLLAVAAQERRVMVTCNYHDPASNFCTIHREWQADGKEHAGVLLIPQEAISRFDERWRTRDRLLRFLDEHTWDELYNQLWWLT